MRTSVTGSWITSNIFCLRRANALVSRLRDVSNCLSWLKMSMVSAVKAGETTIKTTTQVKVATAAMATAAMAVAAMVVVTRASSVTMETVVAAAEVVTAAPLAVAAVEATITATPE